MYIKVNSPATRRIALRIEGFEEPVRAEFNEEGVARVTSDEGEALAREVEGITIEQREERTQEEDE